jgi:hypothetical protein
VLVLWAFFITLTQASSVQDIVVSYQLRVRRRVYVQPYRSMALQSSVVFDQTSPFDPLLYRVRSLS